MRNQPLPFLPTSFALCERSSGAVRFRVEAGPDGRLPVEKIAGLLAVHCLVRGQAPEDYELMIITREPLLDAVSERAQELLAAGRALGAGVKVSRREQEVLDGIFQNLANKEIAAKLNVSERTVKFHVSSLLAKFGVTDRVALSREAALAHLPAGYSYGPPAPHGLFGFQVPSRQDPMQAKMPSTSPPNAADPPREVPRARNRVFPIFPRSEFAT